MENLIPVAPRQARLRGSLGFSSVCLHWGQGLVHQARGARAPLLLALQMATPLCRTSCSGSRTLCRRSLAAPALALVLAQRRPSTAQTRPRTDLAPPPMPRPAEMPHPAAPAPAHRPPAPPPPRSRPPAHPAEMPSRLETAFCQPRPRPWPLTGSRERAAGLGVGRGQQSLSAASRQPWARRTPPTGLESSWGGLGAAEWVQPRRGTQRPASLSYGPASSHPHY